MNFKKITAIGTSVLIAGMTMGLAAAATYPAPFVQNGAGDFAVVYGTGAGVSSFDFTNAQSLSEALADKVTSTVGLGDETVQIKAPGNDLTFADNLDDVKEKLTDSDLPTILAARKIRDADGTIDYEQWLELGAHGFAFDTLDDDKDNYVVNTDLAPVVRPVLHIDQSGATEAWSLVVDFDGTVDFTTIRNGEKLVLAGKEYAVAKDLASTDANLVLYASSQTVTIPATETKTVTVDGISYEIYVEGANTDSTVGTATVHINGEADSVEEGDTIYVGDQEFYINRIFMQTVPTPAASVEIFAGADKLELPKADGTVKVNGEEVDGVEVVFEAGNLAAETMLTFKFTPSELDLDTDEASYLEIGESIADPVFGTVALKFDSASMDLKDEDKGVVEFKRVGSDLQLKFTNRNGNEYAFTPLSDDETDSIDWHDNFYADNTAALAKNDLVILQEGTSAKSAITRIAKVTSSVSGTEITLEDISTGAKATLEDGDRVWSTTLGTGAGTFAAGAYACHNVSVTWGDSDGTNTTTVMDGWFLAEDTNCAITNTTATGTTLADVQAHYLYPMHPLYTQENAMITLPSSDGAGTAVINIEESYDATEEDFDVTITQDSMDKGEFAISLTSAEWLTNGGYAADDESENGYYLSAYGTYAEVDLEDDDLATFYVPAEEVTYNVYVGSVAESETETGAILVKDSEVASVATKNLIVVGGSCINSAAATLIGGAKCGDAWVEATGADTGKFVVRSYASNSLTSKLAVLVAGYDAADTTNAVSYFQNKVTDTSKNHLGTSAISGTVVA